MRAEPFILDHLITGRLTHASWPGQELQLQAAGLIPVHSKSGNLQIESTVFEIGGRGKSRRQLKSQQQAFVVSDDILASVGERIALYLFGLLY